MPTEQWREQNKSKMRSYRTKWYRRNKEHAVQMVLRRRRLIELMVDRYKADRGCADCPEAFVPCLQFHHLDPSKKEIDISRAILRGWSEERLLIEMKKCAVVCANCHIRRHVKMARSRGVDPLSPGFGDLVAQPVPSVFTAN
jgi:hypothetical protein